MLLSESIFFCLAGCSYLLSIFSEKCSHSGFLDLLSASSLNVAAAALAAPCFQPLEPTEAGCSHPHLHPLVVAAGCEDQMNQTDTWRLADARAAGLGLRNSILLSLCKCLYPSSQWGALQVTMCLLKSPPVQSRRWKQSLWLFTLLPHSLQGRRCRPVLARSAPHQPGSSLKVCIEMRKVGKIGLKCLCRARIGAAG